MPSPFGDEPPRRQTSAWRRLWIAVVVLVVGAVRIGLVFVTGEPDADPPAGFAGDVSQPPVVGEWRASGRTTQSRGYLGARDVGETIIRRWTTTRRCAGGRCSFVMTRTLADSLQLSSPLTRHADGWHATFHQPLPCRVVDGRQVTWDQRSSFVLRFTNGGRRAEAHQVNLSYAPRCGYGTSRTDWTASAASPGTDPLRSDGPVSRVRGPVNGIGEPAMAVSVGRAAAANAGAIREQVVAALGRPKQFVVFAGQTRCRSRESTPEPTGAPFACVVMSMNPDRVERFALQILVTDIEGHCWRGVHVAVKGGDGRWVDYDEAAVERVLGRAPLRGCA